jgi:quinol-cytochrome oxidoreductase complex cytochrome b subunit
MSISALASGTRSDDNLALVTKFIPTEVIAIYVTIGTLYDPLRVRKDSAGNDIPLFKVDFTSRWILFWVMLAVTPLITYLIFRQRVTSPNSPPSQFVFRKWLTASVYAMIGLTIWAMALPDTPAKDFEFWKEGIAAAVLFIFTTSVPLLPGARALDSFADPT